MDLIAIIIVIVALVIFIPELVHRLNGENVEKFAQEHQVVLLVTAHPDDECMFFSPTILALKKYGVKVHILCLSRGDFYGKGEVRERELLSSCKVLGIKENHCSLIDDKKLPDNPNVKWEPKLIAKYIEEKVVETKASLVITFDERGVSGHANHKALNEGLRLISTNPELKNLKCYQLESVSVVRKYLGVLDVSVEHLTSEQFFISTWREVILGQRAMVAHWSQFVWFRLLYIVFSRYMVINTILPLENTANPQTHIEDASEILHPLD